MCSIIGRLTSGSIGLGALRGERTQTGALAARHDHGLHGSPDMDPNLPRCRTPASRARPSRSARSPIGT